RKVASTSTACPAAPATTTSSRAARSAATTPFRSSSPPATPEVAVSATRTHIGIVETPAPVPPAYDRAHGLACAVTPLAVGLPQGLTVWGINNNLPALQGELGATALEASWLNTAYFATALSAVVPLTKLRLQGGLDKFATWSIVAFVVVTAAY